MQNINTATLFKNINGLWNNIDTINMNVNNSMEKIDENTRIINENTERIAELESKPIGGGGSNLFKEKELNGEQMPLIDMRTNNNLYLECTENEYGYEYSVERRISMESVSDKSYITFNSDILADSLNYKNGTTWTTSYNKIRSIIYFNGYLHGLTESWNGQKYYVTSKYNGKNWTDYYMDSIKCEYLDKVNDVLFRISNGKLQCLLTNSTVWNDILDDASGCIMKYVNENYILIRNDSNGEKNIFKLSRDMKVWVDIPAMENYPLINEVLFEYSKYVLQFSNLDGSSNAINVRNDILVDENVQYEVNDIISSNIQMLYYHIYFGTNSNKIIMLDYAMTDPQEYNSAGKVMIIKAVPQGLFATGLFDNFLVLKSSAQETNRWFEAGTESKIKPSADGIPPYIDAQQREWTYVITQDGTGNVATWYRTDGGLYLRNFPILNDCKILKGGNGKILSDKKLFTLDGGSGGHCYEVYPSNFQNVISTPFIDYIYYADQHGETKEIIVSNDRLGVTETNIINVDVSSINNKLTNINYSNGVTTLNGTLNTSDVNINGSLSVTGEINSRIIEEQAEKITQLETQIANIKNTIYPINIVIYLSVDTNPSNSSILGFGTWEKINDISVNGVFAYRRTG